MGFHNSTLDRCCRFSMTAVEKQHNMEASCATHIVLKVLAYLDYSSSLLHAQLKKETTTSILDASSEPGKH